MFAPEEADSGVLVFKVRGVAPRRVRRGYLERRGERRAVKAERIRDAAGGGVLRVKMPSAWRARAADREDGPPGRARLVVLVGDEGDLGRTTCGSPSVTEGLGNFGVGRWPGACWRPYADDSPFNQRLPRRPPLDPRSDAIVRRVTGWGDPASCAPAVSGTEGDWQHPIYYPDGNDPVFEIHCAEDWGDLRDRGHAGPDPRRRRGRRRVRRALTVVDQDSGWEYDFWQVRASRAAAAGS